MGFVCGLQRQHFCSRVQHRYREKNPVLHLKNNNNELNKQSVFHDTQVTKVDVFLYILTYDVITRKQD